MLGGSVTGNPTGSIWPMTSLLRGVIIVLLSEGVEGVNWEQTEAAACAKALGCAGSMLCLGE